MVDDDDALGFLDFLGLAVLPLTAGVVSEGVGLVDLGAGL